MNRNPPKGGQKMRNRQGASFLSWLGLAWLGLALQVLEGKEPNIRAVGRLY
jgi:hypothetical protein